MHDICHPSDNKNTCFALARLVLAFRLFEGFSWPSEGLRPSSGQKIPQTALRPKQPGCSKKRFFVLPHDSYVGAFLLKTYHFSDIRMAPAQMIPGAILMSEKKVVFWPKLLHYILSSLFCKVVFSPHFRLYFLPTPVYDSQWVRFQFGTIFSTVPYNLNNSQSNIVSQ